MKNTAKYALSFSRNSSFLRGLFYYAAPCSCIQCASGRASACKYTRPASAIFKGWPLNQCVLRVFSLILYIIVTSCCPGLIVSECTFWFQTAGLSSIFALYTVCGFPKVFLKHSRCYLYNVACHGSAENIEKYISLQINTGVNCAGMVNMRTNREHLYFACYQFPYNLLLTVLLTSFCMFTFAVCAFFYCLVICEVVVIFWCILII